ncbi:hypothetical protein ACWC9U_05095 [Streptomyces sp. 900116325]
MACQAHHAASTSVEDISHELLGEAYSGTDHVSRLNGPRVEAFSGVGSKLFDVLAHGHVDEYRTIVHGTRHDRPHIAWDKERDGPVSVDPDGSVLAIRLLPKPDGVRRQSVRASRCVTKDGGRWPASPTTKHLDTYPPSVRAMESWDFRPHQRA